MDELAQAAGKTATDLAQRIRVGQLAEQHADELCPTRESPCVTFSVVFLDDAGKLGSGDLPQELTKSLSVNKYCFLKRELLYYGA
jgi:hypothetical protein